MSRNKWDERWLDIAQHYSTFSKDPSSQIGAIAVSPSNIQISAGWNGLPRGIEDTKERLTDRAEKYKYVVHAEKNLIYNASYNGICLKDCSLYVYGIPVCSQCALGIIQVGIKRVLMRLQDNISDHWWESFGLTADLFDEVNISYEIRSKAGQLIRL